MKLFASVLAPVIVCAVSVVTNLSVSFTQEPQVLLLQYLVNVLLFELIKICFTYKEFEINLVVIDVKKNALASGKLEIFAVPASVLQ